MTAVPANLPPEPPRGPKGHQAVKRLLGLVHVDDLLVLHRNNDPFFQGTEAHCRDARWFADMWHRFGATGHLRRLHYKLMSTDARTATGKPYENTYACWHQLGMASKSARALGLVDPEAVSDQRNAPPRRFVIPRLEPVEPGWSWEEGWNPASWELPTLKPWMLTWGGRPEMPPPEVDGYDYDPADQLVLLELWVEKSTMDDVLVPLCSDLHVNLVSGTGFESVTAAVSLLRRAARHGKPAHVLYVSDHDPAGEQMPIAVARQAQFYLAARGIEANLTMEQVALTAAQVREYDLPRVPIKDTDRRRTAFEARHGEGAVELDALEALHPGALADVVRQATQPYLDQTLPERLARSQEQAQQDTGRAWAEATRDVRRGLADVQREVGEVVDRFRRERLEPLAAELAAELAPHQDRLEELAAEASRIRDAFDPELPARPEPAEPQVDRSGLLFDSTRHWWDQLRAFKRLDGTKEAPTP